VTPSAILESSLCVRHPPSVGGMDTLVLRLKEDR
jgi:hypothetical protein